MRQNSKDRISQSGDDRKREEADKAAERIKSDTSRTDYSGISREQISNEIYRGEINKDGH